MYYPYKDNVTIEFVESANPPSINRIASQAAAPMEGEVGAWLNRLQVQVTLHERQGLTFYAPNGDIYVVDDLILPLRLIISRSLHGACASGIHTVALAHEGWVEETLYGIKMFADNSDAYDLLIQIIANYTWREVFVSKMRSILRD